MMNLEYAALMAQQHREMALSSTLARDACHLRELELAHQATGRRHRAGASSRLVGSGLLASLRARFGWRSNGVTTAARP